MLLLVHFLFKVFTTLFAAPLDFDWLIVCFVGVFPFYLTL